MGLVDHVVNEWKRLEDITRFMVDIGKGKAVRSDTKKYGLKEIQVPETTSTYSERIADNLTCLAYTTIHPIKSAQAYLGSFTEEGRENKSKPSWFVRIDG